MFNLLAAQYGTVSDIEILWTLIAAFGVFFSAFNTREATADLKALNRGGVKNGRLLLAQVTIRSEIARLIIQVIFFIIGVLAMLVKNSADVTQLPLRLQLLSIFFSWGLIVCAGLVALKSYWAYKLRTELKKHYDDPQERAEIDALSLQDKTEGDANPDPAQS